MRAPATTTPAVDIHAAYNKSKLFLISVIALVTAGVSFSMRASVASTLRITFFDPINPVHSAEMIGAVLGVGSLGFALTIAIGSPMLDFLGMGRLLLSLIHISNHGRCWYAQAASTITLRKCEFPVLVIAPRRMRLPLECSLDTNPLYPINFRGSKREKLPISETIVTAVI